MIRFSERERSETEFNAFSLENARTGERLVMRRWGMSYSGADNGQQNWFLRRCPIWHDQQADEQVRLS